MEKKEWIQMLEGCGFEIFEMHRFEKTFHYEPWCNRMKLSVSEKDKLTQYILDASPIVKEKFKIVIEDEKIVSFQGEAIVLKAVKR
jgi:hypothetical protein